MMIGPKIEWPIPQIEGIPQAVRDLAFELHDRIAVLELALAGLAAKATEGTIDPEDFAPLKWLTDDLIARVAPLWHTEPAAS